MDAPAPDADDSATADNLGAAHAILAQVELVWASGQHTNAVILHAARNMLVLELVDPRQTLPPLGTAVTVHSETRRSPGRLAEHGRAGRFLVSIGERPVRRALRLKVSLPGVLRCHDFAEPREIEIVDLTTGGARIRDIELPVGTQVTLDFTPPGRTQPVTVRASVAHGTHAATRPWVGIAFRLVAMRGGRPL